MLLPLAVLLLQTTTPPPPDGPAARDARPVRVWLGSGGALTRGTPVRVYVQAAQDGNLIVLHRRTDGRIEILFPGSPKDDPYVRAGTYEIQATRDRVAFVVAEPDGNGLVLAALSTTNYRFDEFARNAAWSPDALAPSWSDSDGEGAVSDVVQRMLGDGYFNYDIVAYSVAPVAPPAYAMQQDTAAGAPVYPTCTDCTFIGFQENVFEPLALCDAFFSPCGDGGRFRHHPHPGGAPAPVPTSAIALSMRAPASVSPIPQNGRATGGRVQNVSGERGSVRPRARVPDDLQGRAAPLRVIPLAPGRRPVAHAPAAPVVPVRRRMMSFPVEASEDAYHESGRSGSITLTGLTVTAPTTLAGAGESRPARVVRGAFPEAGLVAAAPRARALAVSGSGGGGSGGSGGSGGPTAAGGGRGIALPPTAFHGAQARIPAGRAAGRRR